MNDNKEGAEVLLSVKIISQFILKMHKIAGDANQNEAILAAPLAAEQKAKISHFASIAMKTTTSSSTKGP